jgi:integrase/recombinase XerC
VNPGLVRARLVLQEAQALGLDIVDLIAAADQVPDVPTVAAFLASIEPTFTRATASTYRPFWRLAVDLHGDRRLADLGITELQAVVDAAVARARRNRPGSTGRASTETCIAALRALFRRAAASGLVTANPAASLTKPRRARPRRRALDVLEQTELIDAVRATSPDPGLHLLLVRFHLETGARRSGALALRRVDLDERRSTVWLVEKGGSREQQVSPSLLAALQRHGTDLADGVFHRRDGQAITAATTTSSSPEPAPHLPGPTAPRYQLTCSDTPPSPRSVVSAATPSPKPSPVTTRPPSPGATSTRRSPKSPPPWRS